MFLIILSGSISKTSTPLCVDLINEEILMATLTGFFQENKKAHFNKFEVVTLDVLKSY